MIKEAVLFRLFRRGQYYSGIVLPPGAEVFRYIIAPRKLCTGKNTPPPPPSGIRGGSVLSWGLDVVLIPELAKCKAIIYFNTLFGKLYIYYVNFP